MDIIESEASGLAWDVLLDPILACNELSAAATLGLAVLRSLNWKRTNDRSAHFALGKEIQKEI